ncbi:GtrA family protein [bacterium]|nr:GtrA family protein [bacterium]
MAKIARFIASGGTSAVFNLALLHVLIGWCGLRGGWREDAAYLVALELSILFQFALCRFWVWKGAEREGAIWPQLIRFHGAAFVTSLGRLVLFTVLRRAGMHYLFNASLGIALGAVVNYFLYEKLVFRTRPIKP